MEFKEVAGKFLKFAVLVVEYCKDVNINPIEKHLTMQLVRSATSCGANYEESRGKKGTVFKQIFSVCFQGL